MECLGRGRESEAFGMSITAPFSCWLGRGRGLARNGSELGAELRGGWGVGDHGLTRSAYLPDSAKLNGGKEIVV